MHLPTFSTIIRKAMLLAIILTLINCKQVEKKEKQQHDAEWTSLWNGKDFSNWRKFLAKPHNTVNYPSLKKDGDGQYTKEIGFDNDSLGVFKVVLEDGNPAIRVSGEIFGTINTVKAYQNYHLKLKFKWGNAKYAPRENQLRDSGLLFHCYENPEGRQGSAWANCQEFQIQETDLGDFWVVGTNLKMTANTSKIDSTGFYKYNSKGKLRTAYHQHEPKDWSDVRIAKQLDNEKKHGEWNELDLYCYEDSSIFIVNGKVVNRLSHSQRKSENGYVKLVKGNISLQSEGAEIYFKDIYIRNINEMPN